MSRLKQMLVIGDLIWGAGFVYLGVAAFGRGEALWPAVCFFFAGWMVRSAIAQLREL